MAYIGNTPADKFLTLAKQNFSTSATTSYTLDSSVSSTQDIALFINNVRQSPVDAYTVSGTALTLTSATAGTDEMYCVYLGKTVGTVVPASDSITTAMIQANAVTTTKVTDGNITGAKLNTDVISAQTALGVAPADTDEFLVSDAGVLKRVDYSLIKGGMTLLSTQTASTSSSITFTGLTTTYPIYLVTINGLYSSSSGDAIRVATTTDGSNYNIQGYGALSTFNTTGASGTFATTTGQPNAAGAVAFGYYISNASGDTFNADLLFYETATSSRATLMKGQSVGYTSANKYEYGDFLIKWSGGVNTALQFSCSAGTMTGTFKLYGLL